MRTGTQASPRRPRWSTAAALLAAAVLLTGCAREFDVQGRVVGFGTERTVIVDHEAVEGFMPAMTMSFRAAEGEMLDSLALGDAIRFELVVTRDRSWIRDIERLPPGALGLSPSGENVDRPTGRVDTLTLAVGDPAPDFALTDQRGRPVRLDDYRGRALVLTFIYTRCPLPDYCPLMSRHFQVLQEAFAARHGTQAQLLSVSFDPAYDTPEVLAGYGRRYDQDEDVWRLATGEPEAVYNLARRLGVSYQDATREILHNLRTVLVGPDGTIRAVWRGNEWTPGEVLPEVEAVLSASGPDAAS